MRNGQVLPILSSIDVFTGATTGKVLNVKIFPCKSFALLVVQTGGVTSWSIVLEGSLDNINFDTILTHDNSIGSGKNIWSSAVNTPCLYFRTRCVSISGGTNLTCTNLGMP